MSLFNFIKYNNARGKDKINNKQHFFNLWLCPYDIVWLKDLLYVNIIVLKRFESYHSC